MSFAFLIETACMPICDALYFSFSKRKFFLKKFCEEVSWTYGSALVHTSNRSVGWLAEYLQQQQTNWIHLVSLYNDQLYNVCLRKKKLYKWSNYCSHADMHISTCLTFHSNNNTWYGSFRFTVLLAVYCSVSTIVYSLLYNNIFTNPPCMILHQMIWISFSLIQFGFRTRRVGTFQTTNNKSTCKPNLWNGVSTRQYFKCTSVYIKNRNPCSKSKYFFIIYYFKHGI